MHILQKHPYFLGGCKLSTSSASFAQVAQLICPFFAAMCLDSGSVPDVPANDKLSWPRPSSSTPPEGLRAGAPGRDGVWYSFLGRGCLAACRTQESVPS